MGWKQNIATSIFSRDFIQLVKREKTLFWFRLLCFSPQNLLKIYRYRKQSSIKINVGSGRHQVEGWLAIDLQKTEGIRWDVRWGLPLRSKSVTHIHCEHFLEHLDYPHDAVNFLKECKRVLAPSGTFRLVVPDAGKYIAAYSKSESSYWEALSDLGGGPVPFDTEIEIVNQAFRMGGDHLFAYDKKTLENALSKAGFSKVEEGKHDPTSFQDQSEQWRIVESLYLTVNA